MTDTQLPSDWGKQPTHRLDSDVALRAAGLGVWEVDTTTNLVVWDDQCRKLFGLAKDNPLPYEEAIQYIHADDVDRVNQAVKRAMSPGSGGRYDETYRTIGVDDGKLRWVRFWGQAYFTPAGTVDRFVGVAQQVPDRMLARQKVQEIQQQWLASFDDAPVGIAIISQQALTFQLTNPFYRRLVGRSADQLVGKSFLEAMPELAGQGFDHLLQEVMATGNPYVASEVAVDLVREDHLETIYVNLTLQPIYEGDGRVSGVLVVATDVTPQVLSRRQVETSETKLRAIIAAAPAAIGLFVGRELIIENPNQTFIDLVGKGPHIEGLPLREAMPELLTEGQPFLSILDEVFTTGVPFISPASLVKIVQNGVLNDNYYNVSYTPLYNAAGEVYAILDIAIDVTAQVQAQQALEETKQALQGAIELAKLGTWQMDLSSGLIEYSPRLRAWHGLTPDEVITRERAHQFVCPADSLRVRAALAQAIQPDGTGHYDVEYVVRVEPAGQQRILHAQGKAYFDEGGQAQKIVGTVQDVTEQRHLQLALEQQVQERTEELAAANEELLASYEEATSANDRITEANHLLSRSNESLQQFAYIASHDLQEPLRKIQSFGALLETEYGPQLGEGVNYLQRMQASAGRLSALIQDLLTFSRIATQRDTDGPTSLDEVVGLVLTDLELPIRESGATIKVGYLPPVNGDARQLGQLFQNLLSNAIKFRPSTTAPVIEISSTQITHADLPEGVTPTRLARAYHRIDVVDNGIGFEQHYVDRIFQVFQRLHGRQQYAGTGIGLAICEKVVTNHGGAIVASSQPGQGATFSVYLPF